MPYQVIMPQLGETDGDIHITRWLHGEGDPVSQFEPLVEVDSHLIGSVIPCPATGTLLKIAIPTGSAARAGTVLGWVRPHEEEAVSTMVIKMEHGTGEEFISPVVAKLARQWNVDLSQLTGSGAGGRITRQDVLAYIQSTRVDAVLEDPAGIAPATEAPLLLSTSEGSRMEPEEATEAATLTPATIPPSYAAQGTLLAEAVLPVPLLTAAQVLFAVGASLPMLFPSSEGSGATEGGGITPSVSVHFPQEEGGEGFLKVDDLPRRTLKELEQALGWAARRKPQPNVFSTGVHVTLLAEDEPFTYFPPLPPGAWAALCIGAPHQKVALVGSGGQNGVAVRQVCSLSLVFDSRLIERRAASHFLSNLVERLQTLTKEGAA